MSKTPAPHDPPPRKRIQWQDPADYLGGHPLPSDRFATPFPFLNDAFGGGLWPGQVYTIQGAPSAGKSSLGVQIAGYYAREHRQKVYVLASDEGTRAACVRLGQAAGIERDGLELGQGDPLERLRFAYSRGLVNVVDADAPEALFETFLEQIEEEALERPGSIPLLYADSIQAISTAKDATLEKTERVAYVMELSREFVRRTNAIILFISHVTRQKYAAKREEDQVDPLAAAAMAIEIIRYSDAVLDLSGDRHQPKGIKAILAKNRLHRGAKAITRLRYDFDRGNFAELDQEELKTFEDEQLDEKSKARAEAREKKAQKERESRADRIEKLVKTRPGKLSKSKIYSEIGGRRETIFELVDSMDEVGRIYLDLESGTYFPGMRPKS